jgi:hypothetical protein
MRMPLPSTRWLAGAADDVQHPCPQILRQPPILRLLPVGMEPMQIAA